MITPAVTNGVLKRISVSQINTYDAEQGGCPRKWYYQKVMKVAAPTTKAQQTGTDLHAEIEHYLKTGEKALGKLAMTGFEYMPAPKTVEVEHSIKDFSILNIPLEGYIDVLDLTQEIPRVLDWKTTGNLDYAKTGEQLKTTVQMPIYGLYAMQLTNANSVRLSHVYFRTKGAPKCQNSTTILTLDEAQERYQSISATVQDMKQTASIPMPLDVPTNIAVCGAFGGCPYQDRCLRSTTDTIRSLFSKDIGESTMGLFGNLTKTPSTPTKTTTPKIDPKITSDLLAEEQRAIEAFAPILPKDAKPSKGKGIAQPMTPAELALQSPEIQAAVEAIEGAQQGMQQSFAAPQEAPKGLSLRATVAPDNKELEIARGANEALTKKVARLNALLRDRPESAPTEQPHILEIYADCTVSGLDCSEGFTPVDLAPIIQETVDRLCREHDTPDLRTSKRDPLGYGCWKGVLADAILKQDINGRFFLLRVAESDFKQVALAALESRCTKLIRGL